MSFAAIHEQMKAMLTELIVEEVYAKKGNIPQDEGREDEMWQDRGGTLDVVIVREVLIKLIGLWKNSWALWNNLRYSIKFYWGYKRSRPFIRWKYAHPQATHFCCLIHPCTKTVWTNNGVFIFLRDVTWTLSTRRNFIWTFKIEKESGALLVFLISFRLKYQCSDINLSIKPATMFRAGNF